MGRVVPDRVRAAVEVVAPGPDDRVLEVGGGPGAAAELICPRLTGSGSMVAADRSQVAVRRTAERNAAHVASGRLVVVRAALHEVTGGPFDVAFTVNVNLFWTRDPGPELAVLRRVLAPGGVLHVLYGGGAVPEAVTSGLRTHGWSVAEVRGDGVVGVSARVN